MKIIKKYWWLILILLIIPFIICTLYFILHGNGIIKGEADWLSFTGGYIGVLLSTLVAFFILHKQLNQNHEENEYNRKLQLKAIKYEQELKMLENMKVSFGVLFKSLDHQKLITLRDKIVLYYFPDDQFKITYNDVIKNMDDFVGEINQARYVYYTSLTGMGKLDEKEISYLEEINNIINGYADLLIDLKALIDNFVKSPDEIHRSPNFIRLVIDKLKKDKYNTHISEITIKLIEEENYSFYDNADSIINKRVLYLSESLKLTNRMPSVLYDFLDHEQKKIDDELRQI